MFYGKPLITIKLEFESCAYFLFVNGGLVAMNTRPMAANEIHPINHWLRHGENLVELRVLKPSTAEEWAKTKATYTLRVEQAGASDDKTTDLARTVWRGGSGPGTTAGSSPAGQFDSARALSPSKSGDVVVSEPVLTEVTARETLSIKRRIRLPLPFREWAFLRSDPMPEVDKMTDPEAEVLYRDLLEAYQPIWKAIKSGNLASVMPVFEERSQEVDEALYKTPGSTQSRMKQMLQEALDDPEFTLQPALPPEGRRFSLVLGSESNLATIVRSGKGSPVLRFSAKKDEGGPSFAKVFPVFWRRSKGKFIVAR